MVGPTALRSQTGGGVQGRDTEWSGAPLRVSDEGKSRNMTPKSTQHVKYSHGLGAVAVDRPSTSGGISTRRPINRPETRDDLHLNPLRSNQIGTTYYNFPLPASFQSPVATSRSSTPRPHGPEYAEPVTAEPYFSHSEVEIGMALGSPTQQPISWGTHVQIHAMPRNDSPESLDIWKASAVPSRSKSRWRTLGGLFGKKLPEPPAAFYQLRMDELPGHESESPLPSAPREPARGRGRTTSEKYTVKPKPDIQRANTIPMDFQFQESIDRPEPPKQFPIPPSAVPPEIQLDGGPMLDVDIPSIQMERYSVMFGSVIKSTTKSSALLARRQATLDRLKTVNEAIARHERHEAEAKSKLRRPRRATSPQPTKSPAMSLFPTTSRTQKDPSLRTPQKPSPLHRSNTSPAALSPNRQTFEPPRTHYEEHTIMLVPTPTNLQPTATLETPWSPEDSYLALESPSSTFSDEEVHSVAPLRPRLAEPKWEMISPPVPDKSLKPKAIQGGAKRNEAINRLPRKQSIQPSPDALAGAGADKKAEELIKSAADVSIARQISVSRSQQQLLFPIQAKIASAAAKNVVQAGIGRERPADLELDRLVVRKPMMPTLVNVQSGRIVRSERAVLVRV